MRARCVKVARSRMVAAVNKVPGKDHRRILSLAELPIGVSARVVAVNGSGAVTRRLMEMGVVPGALVRVIKAAPLGDPLQVLVRSYHLALRIAEADTITVAAVTNE